MRPFPSEREHEMTLKKIDRSNTLAAFTLALALLVYGAILGALEGCPVRVDPATEDVCGSRPNCGLCASEAVCVWCPGSNTCVGRSSGPDRCDIETVISLPEMCEGAVPEEEP